MFNFCKIKKNTDAQFLAVVMNAHILPNQTISVPTEKGEPMEVEIIKHPTDEDWMFCKQCTLVTVGKDTINPPTEKFKRDLLRARHSPIRVLQFGFYLKDIPYWVSVHLCRHIHAQPYVKTQRNDRQGSYDRDTAPQNAPVDMIWYMNAEELINIANKRLCRQSSAETRELVKMVCREVIAVCPEFEKELVPMCVRNGGRCYEMFPCTGL